LCIICWRYIDDRGVCARLRLRAIANVDRVPRWLTTWDSIPYSTFFSPLLYYSFYSVSVDSFTPSHPRQYITYTYAHYYNIVSHHPSTHNVYAHARTRNNITPISRGLRPTFVNPRMQVKRTVARYCYGSVDSSLSIVHLMTVHVGQWIGRDALYIIYYT